MRKHSVSQSGIFQLRGLAALLFTACAILLSMASFAANVGNGTLTDSSGPITFQAGPFLQSNQSPLGLGQVDTGPRCDDLAFPCSTYTLTVNLPFGYMAAHPNALVKVTMSWQDSGAGKSDYDLYIFNNPRNDCSPMDCSQPNGSNTADYQSSSGKNPEIALISPLADGAHNYTVLVNPYQPTGETVTVKMELLPGDAHAAVPGFGGPDPSAPGVPRYQIFEAPLNTSADPSNGEFNIGYNPKTGRIMTMNSGPVWRITPPEILKPAKPECCEGLWEDKSAQTTNIGLDPILWTDQVTGRTFVSNSTAGANAVYAYSDDDGDTYVEGGASPPNGGADHETIGSGPYPALLASLGTPVNQGEAVYYCSQDIVGPASCQRSDTLGASYGPGVLAYNGQGSSTPGGTDCGGLHGHLHVAPDGTVWLPVNQCANSQGGVFSTDAGTTWTEFKVPNAVSQQQGADPSIAIDSDGTIYYSYVNNEPVGQGQPPEGHAHVVTGKLDTSNNTIAWSNNTDIGATHGIKNAAENEAVGGSSGRAAVGFLGTDLPGDYQADSFQGNWYAFIATTYDQGKTWVTVNATPNDPVQNHTGVWQQGGSHPDRNLLDFNEITLDTKGRVLYGYSDGCVTPACIAGTAGNDFTAYMRVARQTGGKTLLASNDANTDTTAAQLAKPPCLSGTRDAGGSHLTWKAPDNGGSDIVDYYVYRATASGAYDINSPIGHTVTAKTSFTDAAAADPTVKDYFYVVRAVNSLGKGAESNEIDLQISASPVPQTACALPGITVLTDPPNDELDQQPAHDVQSLSVAEPFALGDKMVFTLKMQSLSTLPPDTEWPVTFNSADGKNYTVQMTTSPVDDPANPAITTTPEFQVGPTGGTLVAADAVSNYNADGTITMVVPKKAIGNPQTGQALSGFLTRIAANLVGITLTPDNMPDGLNPSGTYTLVGNTVGCVPNLQPTANLSVTPDHGPAPLTVTLDGSKSSDPDAGDSVASYTFDFGDGSAPVTQSSATVTHTYNTAGEYPAHLTVTDSHGATSTNTALAVVEVDAVLRNISTRGMVQTSDNVLIAGLIVTGNDARNILLRGIGPSQSVNGQPVAGALQDPTLELHDESGAIITTNDNWKTDDKTGQSQQTAIEGTGIPPKDDRESAILMTLNPGKYTAVLRGKNDSTGVALVEAYDLNPFATSKLGNISTRGVVGTGDNVMIGGFVAGPENAAPLTVLIRGLGPSLTSQGVPGALPDPTLELHNANGDTLKVNDNWKDSQQSEIEGTGIPPSDDRESAMVTDIAPGNYTAILAGKDGATGIGLVEIYNIDQ